MDRYELIEKYDRFIAVHGLLTEEVVVGAGGALCVLGLREQTSDIDVDVPEEVFQRLLGMGLPTHVFEVAGRPGVLVIEAAASIDVHLRTNTDPVVFTDGVAHYTPEVLLAFKQRLNREKDQEDIRKLKAFLGI